MKNLIVAIIVAVGLATGTPAAVGWFLERDANARVDQALEQASFVTVTEHKYHRGWFRSDETITLQLFNGVPMPPIDANAGDAARKPIEITVHNTIQHGPLPGFAGIGLARISTAFVLPPGVLPAPAAQPALGPLTIESTLGFFGGATTTIRHPVIRDALVAEGWHLSADALDFTIKQTRHADTIDVDGKAPHIQLSRDGGPRIEITGLQLAMHSKRALRSIYAGDTDFTIGDFEVTGTPLGAAKKTPVVDKDAPEGELADPGIGAGDLSLRAFKAHFKAESSGEFVSSNVLMTSAFAGAGGYHVQGLKLDFAFEHLQMDAFDRLATGMRKIQRAHPGQPRDQLPAILELWKSDGVKILVNDPSFTVRALEFTSPDGFGKLSGGVHLKGATEADFKPRVDTAALLSKLSAELDAQLNERLAAKLLAPKADAAQRKPSGPSLQSLEAQGFLTRDDGRLSSSVRFVNGALTVNGKPFQGLAGPGPRTP